MTTLDELTKVYADAEFSRQGTGIAAVVRALRDVTELHVTAGAVTAEFNEILGDAGNAAGGSTRKDGTVEAKPLKQEAAATPAAAFCEWNHSGRSHYGTSCTADGVYSPIKPQGGDYCNICCKPIKFTEVTPWPRRE